MGRRPTSVFDIIMKPAIVAITRNGASLASKIRDAWPGGAVIHLPAKFAGAGEKDTRVIRGGLPALVARLFARHESIVFVMAAGVVVRLIAPLVKDKTTDPAVVVMDEAGRFAVSLLSGHIGGANELAGRLAALTGGQAVVTTASDTQGSLAVDTLAMRLGCVVEDMEKAKKVTAALVNGGKVALYAPDMGAEATSRLGPLPPNIRLVSDLAELLEQKGDAAIIINPSLLPVKTVKPLGPIAFLRPRSLVVGLGCNRNTTADEIGLLYFKTLKANMLSPLSVKLLTTVEDKKDETGLLEFALARGLKIRFISRKRLLKAATPSGKSEAVFRNMGVYGVCEPAALIVAGATGLVVPKTKSKNATMAVAACRW